MQSTILKLDDWEVNVIRLHQTGTPSLVGSSVTCYVPKKKQKNTRKTVQDTVQPAHSFQGNTAWTERWKGAKQQKQRKGTVPEM